MKKLKFKNFLTKIFSKLKIQQSTKYMSRYQNLLNHEIGGDNSDNLMKKKQNDYKFWSHKFKENKF